jgi:hypothetical protein
MASESIENRECSNCGEMVRPRALFCYKCGENVAEESSVKVRRKTNSEVSDVWFKDSIVSEEKKSKKLKTKNTGRIKKESVTEQFVSEKIELKVDEPVEAFEEKASESKLKSAATMRNKAKTLQKQKVEMVWDNPENPSSIWFFVASFFLLALVIGILITAWILK